MFSEVVKANITFLNNLLIVGVSVSIVYDCPLPPARFRCLRILATS